MRNQFVTHSGVSVPAVTAEQMREIDRIAMHETGPNLYQMMENAGRDLALLTIELLGITWRKARILVLAGTGGNGGGGICAARHLANRNADVSLCITQPERLDAVSAFQRKIFLATAGKEVDPVQLSTLHADFIIDAIIGYGFRSAPRGRAKEFIHWANTAGAPILSLDVPSGVDATTGTAPGIAIRPQWTLTLALPKTGLSRANAGALYLADIGLPGKIFSLLALDYKDPFGTGYYIPISRQSSRN